MKRKSLILAVSALFMLASCSKDNAVTSPVTKAEDPTLPVAVQFSTKGFDFAPKTKVIDNTWEANDEVGIFMKSSLKNYFDPTDLLKVDNKKYLAQVNYDLNPASGQTIYFPFSQLDYVDFVAYYPYKPGVTSVYPINLAVDPNVDFLYAQAESGPFNRESTLVKFPFVHKFAKLVFNLEGIGIDADKLAGATITIGNVIGKGNVDLATGTISGTEKQTVPAKQTTGLTWEATVLPEDAASLKEITFTFPNLGGEEFTQTITVKYEGNNKYVYTVKVGAKEINAFTSSITTWGQVVDADIDFTK